MGYILEKMSVKQGDIVLLPVPFSDQTTQKVRPAIVVSNDKINSKSQDIILVPVTSVLKEAPHSIIITQNSLSYGKLIVESRVRADKIFTAHKSLIKMKIGAIKIDVLTKIKDEIIKTI